MSDIQEQIEDMAYLVTQYTAAMKMHSPSSETYAALFEARSIVAKAWHTLLVNKGVLEEAALLNPIERLLMNTGVSKAIN